MVVIVMAHCSRFFKPREYLSVEFADYLSGISTVLEVGCGYGCSLFTLLETLPSISTYIATDFCGDALQILAGDKRFDPSKVKLHQWDVTIPAPSSIAALSPSIVLSVFALSAVHPSQHAPSLSNIANVLSVGGYLLFRDYGIADATMYRHASCLEHCLLERNDGTLAYYFSLEYVQSLIDATRQFCVVELSYATVIIANRKKKFAMKRVFVHGVFQRV